MRQALRVATTDEGTVRQSVTIPQALHDALTEIAARNDVSVSYVVRKACEAYAKSHRTECVHELAEASNE